jgi:hypothetical protein
MMGPAGAAREPAAVRPLHSALRMNHTRAPVLAAALAACILSACGGAGVSIEPPAPGPDVPGAGDYRGVPGFDTRDYPGDDVMRAWRDASPYRWVGYYLPAPCYTGTSWEGRRRSLETMGWGIAVLFVGEQDWATPDPVDDAADRPPRCTRSNLTPERGAADARAAAQAAAGEGFGPGTVVYLDVERVESVSPELAAYVRAWFDAMLDDGRYTPGLYAHGRNAAALMATASAAFADAGRGDRPRLWVVSTGGFDLRRAPAESGFPDAAIWQGTLDARETWGGHTLRIDANVASTGSPSG